MKARIKEIAKEFPSPTGVLYLLMRLLNTETPKPFIVSVPYWGSLSSNLLSKKQETLANNLVSVPYWGSLSSNKHNGECKLLRC